MINIPSIQDLYDDILADFESEYLITLNPYGKAFTVALAGVLAGLLWLVYLGIGDTQKNIWFDTADSVKNGGTLERFGVTILGRWPYPAVGGEYECTVTGTNGSVIKGDTQFVSDSTSLNPGYRFLIKGGDYTLSGTSGTITIVALSGGLVSRLDVGNTLTVTVPIAGINDTITVTAETVVPIDAEGIEDYRLKIKEKVQLTPGSWNAVDYRLVGIGVTGVKQTYAYADSGSSAVINVWLQGNTPVASPGPSVSSGVITAYETALALVLPLDVWDVNVASSPINDVVVTIHMGSFPSFSSAQQTDIKNAVKDFVNGITPFIDAADDVNNRNDVIATYNLSALIASIVPGYGFSSVSFTVGGTPETYWQADNGNIAYNDGSSNVIFTT